MARADLVFTGEGKIDSQSVQGKGGLREGLVGQVDKALK
ncbi:MAG: glycerate kinase [Verrucomicrobia bacterium]|nr:glycerate kinase [Verrucomicrobiota bacterium]MBV8377346.1 glycerate kinase [Verrucomicrobiota bacterium]